MIDSRVPELQIASNGSIIPSIDGISLHSKYNPEKEAEKIISQYNEQISENNCVLVLGLGLGYHINVLAQMLEAKYKSNYNLVVIESNYHLAQIVAKQDLIKSKRVSIFAGIDVNNLFLNQNLVAFLNCKPLLISWTHSFNLSRDYFTKFLAYRSPREIKNIISSISDIDMRHYLNSCDQEQKIDYLIEHLKSKNILTTQEQKLLLINEFAKNQKKMSGENNAKSDIACSN